jgi:type IV secretory pathway TraG/TraD family ATPase VirD4
MIFQRPHPSISCEYQKRRRRFGKALQRIEVVYPYLRLIVSVILKRVMKETPENDRLALFAQR